MQNVVTTLINTEAIKRGISEKEIDALNKTNNIV